MHGMGDNRVGRVGAAIDAYRRRLDAAEPSLRVSGTLVRTVGLVMEVVGLKASVGHRCYIETDVGRQVPAEVVGFDHGRCLLMAEGHADGVSVGARVVLGNKSLDVQVGEGLLGRVVDGAGRALDGKGPVRLTEVTPLFRPPINPMSRALVEAPLDVGVRSLNGLLSVGRGARLGLFAGSGVGKSVLLGMMARYTDADVTVVGLIGERGREVKEFVERILGEEGLRRSVVIAAPADESALMRVHAAYRAAAVAEWFRDRGTHVLLLVDSLSRFAVAQREISLAAGELPTARGYPPSVFGRLAGLAERAGNGPQDGGSVTAFYTVLVDGDDLQEPIGDSARAILDGHVVLSRRIAERGQFPAVDMLASASRVMPAVADTTHRFYAQRFREFYSRYEESRDLITLGAYKSGNDQMLDRAIAIHPTLESYLRQDMQTRVSFRESVEELTRIFEV